MKVSNGEGVSPKRVRRVWEAVRGGLEALHLTDFLLHVSHSDALALLILILTRPDGRLGMALLAVFWFWFKVRRSAQEAVMNRDAKQKVEVPTDAPPVEVLIPTPNVPQSLVDLAKQGLDVTITIRLKSAAR
jgi:hypothetical protein